MNERSKLRRWAGGFLVAALLLCAAAEAPALNSRFTFLGALSHVITPNGDGLNDVVFLCFDNPKASGVNGAVYDLRGNRVSGMTHLQAQGNCPGTGGTTVEQLTWNGKSDGRTVSGGTYIYRIQAEGMSITGSVMVVR